MRKIIIGIMFLLLAANAFALQEVAGPLVMSVPVGGSNSTKYGLLNDGNTTINVSITADNNVGKYLSFPSIVELQPKKLTYVNITANIPADYQTTGNITGNIYALQEGASGGQVQINVQMMKSVTIEVYGQPSQTSSEQTTQGTSSQPNEASTPSGFVTMITNNYPIVILVIVIIVLAIIIIIRIRRDSW